MPTHADEARPSRAVKSCNVCMSVTPTRRNSTRRNHPTGSVALRMSFTVACVLAASRHDAPVAPAAARATDEEARAPYLHRYGGSTRDASCAIGSNEEADAVAVAAGPSVHEIFLVPHTHDDVGWKWTVRGYYERSVSGR